MTLRGTAETNINPDSPPPPDDNESLDEDTPRPMEQQNQQQSATTPRRPAITAPRSIPKAYGWIFHLLDNRSHLEAAYGPIILDTFYVIGFILQHSVMKSSIVKRIFHSLSLATAERTIYSLTSSLYLHYLMNNWISTQNIVFWQFDVQGSKTLWWTFTLVHTLAWIIIYGGSIILDLPELFGVKQAYYDLKSYGNPNAYKSHQLRSLLTHVRHPSFLGLTVILWATNLMSLDRLVLAILLTAYMYVSWSTDKNDVKYQKQQLERKMAELNEYR